jgi:hypothetical protein
MIIAYILIGKRVMFSESCSAASLHLLHGVSAGTQKSMEIRLGPSISPMDIDRSKFISHCMKGTCPL